VLLQVKTRPTASKASRELAASVKPIRRDSPLALAQSGPLEEPASGTPGRPRHRGLGRRISGTANPTRNASAPSRCRAALTAWPGVAGSPSRSTRRSEQASSVPVHILSNARSRLPFQLILHRKDFASSHLIDFPATSRDLRRGVAIIRQLRSRRSAKNWQSPAPARENPKPSLPRPCQRLHRFWHAAAVLSYGSISKVLTSRLNVLPSIGSISVPSPRQTATGPVTDARDPEHRMPGSRNARSLRCEKRS
jgi:hypothetical protein